jgi:hypothetical protein
VGQHRALTDIERELFLKCPSHSVSVAHMNADTSMTEWKRTDYAGAFVFMLVLSAMTGAYTLWFAELL